ncbi:hypothetical protein SNE40_012873 [Patella caerulea]|uniref:Fibronectin type-III domain-containing protein n=1 Tax=Patella caerulea TaxID=87958 RepID=A0AAN8PK93_PATCE
MALIVTPRMNVKPSGDTTGPTEVDMCIYGVEFTKFYRPSTRYTKRSKNRLQTPIINVLPKPPPPVVGKVTHFSVELYWDEALSEAVASIPKTDGKLRSCLQEQDKHNMWGNIYTGYGKRHTVTGLEPLTSYRYRLRFLNDKGIGEWSPHVVVATTKEPLNGEHLHRAILLHDVPGLQKIIDTGEVDIDVPDRFGFSGLMQAAQKGFTDVAEVLIENGADVHSQNDAGKTPLMLACFAGKLEVVQLLRSHGARYTDFDKGGSTAVHWAVDGGNTKLLDWIVSDGGDINIKDNNSGWTPLLRCASVGGNRDTGLTLLMNGADINAQDRDGKTTLMIAIINGNNALLELLLQRRADIGVRNEYGKTAYEMAISMERRKIIKTLDEYIEKHNIKT